MFNQLDEMTSKPKLYAAYTIEALWNHPHVSKFMLKAHLQADNHIASRKHAFIDQSVAFMVKKFGLNSDKKVIDFGCGPGLYTTRLAQLGVTVTGIDLSINSINHAKLVAEKEGLDITYTNQNYLTYKDDTQFDLITMIYCDYCALNDLQRHQLLKSFRLLLKKEGYILMDVHTMRFYDKFNTDFTCNKNQEGGFWRPSTYFEFISRFKYDDVTLEKYDVFTADESFQIYNWLKCFSVDSLEKEFETAGLEIVGCYADVSGAPYDDELDTMAVIVRLSQS